MKLRRVDAIPRHRFPVDPWRLVETEPSGDDLGVTETLFAIGNGYLGMRANPEEGRESHSHGTFLNGFHDAANIVANGTALDHPDANGHVSSAR